MSMCAQTGYVQVLPIFMAGPANPLAFLKKDNKLVLGFGAYVNYLGKTWLMNHQAINFNKGRFQFMPAKCNL